MFVGHYAVSYAVKAADRRICLGLLFLAVQAVDVAWAVLVLAGVEKVRIVPGITASNPLDLYYMPYTHSLVATGAWFAAAVVVQRVIGRPRHDFRVSLLVGLAVASHWFLDLIVHRPDLPLYDNAAKVGLGLWNFPAPAFLLEIGLLLLAMGYGWRRGVVRGRGPWIFAGVLAATQAMVFFGAPPASPAAAAATALAAYFAFAGVAEWLDRRLARAAG